MPENRRRKRKPRKPAKRGPPLRSQAGIYLPLLSFFDAFPSFARDPSRTPEQDFRLLQEQQGWEPSTPTYIEHRRKFFTALVDETHSPVHAFFVDHEDFLEYNSTASPYTEFSLLEQLNEHPPDRAAFNAALRAEFNGPLDKFFRAYPQFQYNPRGAPMGEFRRLVSHNAWDPERAKQEEHAQEPASRAYNAAKTSFFDAFRKEFDHLFGDDAEAVSTWQSLCETLGVEPIPGSVTQCRKVSVPTSRICRFGEG